LNDLRAFFEDLAGRWDGFQPPNRGEVLRRLLAPFAPLVVCHNSFPHFADKLAALHDLARVLRPGGHLLVLHDLSREQVNAIHSGGGEAIHNDLLPPGAETRRMLVRAGFGDVQVEDTDEHYVAIGRRIGRLSILCPPPFAVPTA
jgi:SAM-dependent methyltransferase